MVHVLLLSITVYLYILLAFETWECSGKKGH